MNKFEEYQIEIDDKNKNLILNYLESVREYIDKNSLDEDLYFDIEERVFEKLSSQEKINQLNIKKLLNEIGEPEVIFELEEKDGNKNNILGHLKNIKNSSINTIKKVFATGFNVENLLVLIKTIFTNLYNLVKKILIFLYGKSIFLIKYAFKIFKKIFNFAGSFIGFCILLIAILMLFLIPIIYSGLEIGNVNFTNSIPKELTISYSFLVLSIAVFGIYFIVKKRFLIHFLSFGISTILVFSFGFLASTKIYNNYSYLGEIEQTYELETDEEELIFGYSSMNLYGNMYLVDGVFRDYSFELKISDDDKVKVKIITEVFTKDETEFNKIKENLNDFDLKEENKNIFLNLKNREVYKQKGDFTPIFRKIELYLPENKILDYNRYYGYMNYKYGNCPSRKFAVINEEIICVEIIKSNFN